MGTSRRHEMPFGAEVLAGGVRFRLWAPGAGSVSVMLHGPGAVQEIPMITQPGGWHELVTSDASAGSHYKFRIDGSVDVPDPAARANEDTRGASIVVDPLAYQWRDDAWHGRPWHEAVVYELHVGTFTPAGTFSALASCLDHLVELGITVIELMPIADFPGTRGWGYDGVLLFAPDAAYGTPDELKAFVESAHARGLAVVLDVVYNHFGPEGNWLHAYAPQFFTSRHKTPWGDAINFDGEHSGTVRDFFIHNALYWFEEFRIDGLRVDAVHAMLDDSRVHFIRELAARVHDGPGRDRPLYLVLENHANAASLLGAPGAHDTADAQWNDDIHHCLHVILTGEQDGYYSDYAAAPHAMLGRCLAEGFAWQGEISRHGGGRPRGSPSGHLPPTAFVNFLQNHDQIGNRALGERLHQLVADESALIAATATIMLAPAPPMLFMGEEWAAPEPFTYFCDFEPDLAEKVREGRKREFAAFERFASDRVRGEIPDPTVPATFESAKLDWNHLSEPMHAAWLERYRRLLAIRHRYIVPLVPCVSAGRLLDRPDPAVIEVEWEVADGRHLRLVANLSPARIACRAAPPGKLLYATHPADPDSAPANTLEPWSVTWQLEGGE